MSESEYERYTTMLNAGMTKKEAVKTIENGKDLNVWVSADD